MHPDGIILESKCMHMPTQNSSAISGQILLAPHQDDLPAIGDQAAPYYWLHRNSSKRQNFVLLFSQFTMYNISHVQYFLDIVNLCVYP